MNDYLANKIIIGLINFRLTPAEAWKNLCESRHEISDEKQDEIESLILESLQRDEEVEIEEAELEFFFDNETLDSLEEELDWGEDWDTGNDIY